MLHVLLEFPFFIEDLTKASLDKRVKHLVWIEAMEQWMGFRPPIPKYLVVDRGKKQCETSRDGEAHPSKVMRWDEGPYRPLGNNHIVEEGDKAGGGNVPLGPSPWNTLIFNMMEFFDLPYPFQRTFMMTTSRFLVCLMLVYRT